MTKDQIRDLKDFAEYTENQVLAAQCVLLLTSKDVQGITFQLTREACDTAYIQAQQLPEWAARHLPRGSFQVAEMIAQFVLAEAAQWEHVESVHDALVTVAGRIRTADWIPDER